MINSNEELLINTHNGKTVEDIIDIMFSKYIKENIPEYSINHDKDSIKKLLFTLNRKDINNYLREILTNEGNFDEIIEILIRDKEQLQFGGLDIGIYKSFLTANSLKHIMRVWTRKIVQYRDVNNENPILCLAKSTLLVKGKSIFPEKELSDKDILNKAKECKQLNITNDSRYIYSRALFKTILLKPRENDILSVETPLKLLTDEEFIELLNDRLIFKINLNPSSGNNNGFNNEPYLLDFISSIFILEYAFKEQFKHILEEYNITDFNMIDYNIHIDSPYMDLLVAIYNFTKLLLKINPPSTSKNIEELNSLYVDKFVETFTPMIGKSVLTTVIPIGEIGFTNENYDVNRCIHIASLLTKLNKYQSKERSIKETDFLSGDLVSIDKVTQTVRLKLIYTYTGGEKNEFYTDMPFTSIVPNIDPNIRTRLHHMLYTGSDAQTLKFLFKENQGDGSLADLHIFIKTVLQGFNNSIQIIDFDNVYLGKYYLNTTNIHGVTFNYPKEEM